MTTAAISQLLKNKFGESVILEEDFTGLQHALSIQPSLISEVCLFLRDCPETYFDFLSCLSAVDYGIEQQQFGVVYHLLSMTKNFQLVLKVKINNNRESNNLPEVPTVSNVWKTADWHEREAYDLMGIVFTGHSDMRRILCPDDWEGFALRKDYQEAEAYKGIKIKYDRA